MMRADFQSDSQAILRRCLASCWLLLFVAVTTVSGQDAPDEFLFEQEPYDVVTLTDEYEGVRLKVFPIGGLDEQSRREAKPDDKLRIRLLVHPDREYDVRWKDIAKVEFFRELVLIEANRLVSEKHFDNAFHYFAFLLRENADLAGLAPSIDRFLMADASSAFRDGKLEEALAILDEVHQRDPTRQDLQQGLRRVTEQLFARYMQAGEYRRARKTVSWALERFGREQFGTTADTWEKQLSQLARRELVTAQKALEAGKMREAYVASKNMMEIWPDLENAGTIAASISQRYPVVTVGVARPAGILDPREFHDWASRRAGRLRQRMLVELEGYGTEGGLYVSPVATLSTSPDGMQATIQLRRDLGSQRGLELTGYDVSRVLLEMADPHNNHYLPLWREVMESVQVRDVFDVVTTLRHFYLRPESFFQVPLGDVGDDTQQLPTQPYGVLEKTPARTDFVLNQDYALKGATQPREVRELVFRESNTAIQALLRGEIDIVDRIYPGDLERFRRNETVKVESYAVPSIHLLIPNTTRPFMDSRVFRRALVFGINREVLLREDLLGGQQLAGCQVLSGPFPIGKSSDDALGYAYNPRRRPRPYNPRLAYTLSLTAKAQLLEAAKKAGTEPPPEEIHLRLLYPDAEIPRIACTGISQYLTAIGINCESVPLPPGEVQPAEGEPWDLLYTDIVMAEPAVEIQHLLGAAGVTRSGSTYLEAALRRLMSAGNWAEARDGLHEIHDLAHEEVAVIPLWQLVDYFAYRDNVRGLDVQPISLYENIENWQIDLIR
ncbi:MAG: hypothetical protein KDA60_08415 [Planctomycetales bacterium]|nr:hypothetical protein [Planctomycetales bacterium]